MISDSTVLVVGAGPTGLLLAAELCRRGVVCQVVDANPAPLHWDRATVVHPRSLEVFESLGIVEPLLAAGVKQRIARIHSAGKVLGEIDLAICGSRYGFNIGISEEVTEAILTDYLHAQGGEIVRSARLVALKQLDDRLVATIEREGVTQQVSTKWLVGCDGVRSTTRTLSGIELNGSDRTEEWAVFDAVVPAWPDSYEANYAYLDELPVILTALPQKRWRVYLRPSAEDSDLVADAKATLSHYLPAIQFEEVTHPTRFHCHTKVAKQYRSGRILLAGDAAHVCSPSQGHGMNSGLQDAFNLAWKLALVCQGHCHADLLNSYQAERHPVAEMITASGEAFEKAQHITDWEERRARDETLRAVFANPRSRHHESIAEAELDIDYKNSPIVLGNAQKGIAPGERIPDLISIEFANGKRCLLHKLTHRAGHTALIIGGALATIEELAKLEAAVKSARNQAIVEAVFPITAGTDRNQSCAQLDRDAANELGISGLTLLVIRPDGHVGLRAEGDYLQALAKYELLLAE